MSSDFPHPSVPKSAENSASSKENLLDAKRDLIKALVKTPNAKSTDSAQIIPFPRLGPIEELNTDTPVVNIDQAGGFQPVVYTNEEGHEAELATDDDSGVTVTAGPEDDARVCRDFGIDEAPIAKNELDLLRDQTESLGLLERILKKTGTRSIRQLNRRLERDPNAHLRKKEKKGKK